MAESTGAQIRESFFEIRVQFATPFWGVGKDPELFLQSLHLALRKWKVGLKDIYGNKESKTLADHQLSIDVPELASVIRIGLENVTFAAFNPDWSKVEALVEMFETAMNCIQQTANVALELQDVLLYMHVVPGGLDFRNEVRRLVNTEALGDGDMYGVSVYGKDRSLIVDQSAKFPGGVFVRLNRLFAGAVPIGEIATTIYEDELKALGLLGIQGLMQE